MHAHESAPDHGGKAQRTTTTFRPAGNRLPAEGRDLTPQEVLDLQRQAGNRAVVDLLKNRSSSVAALQRRGPGAALHETHRNASQLSSLVEDLWKSLLELSARAKTDLDRVDKSVMEHLDRYDKAFEAFSDTLEQAKQDFEWRSKWNDALRSIIVGAGLGLGAGELFEASTLLGEAVHHLAVKTAETGLDKALEGKTADFEVPRELTADSVARGQLEKLKDAWRGLAIIQAAALAFSQTRDQLRDAGHGGTSHGQPETEAQLIQLKAALTKTDKTLALFLATADTPLLHRGVRTLEQDIWIRWIVSKKPSADTLEGIVAGHLWEIGAIEERGLHGWGDDYYLKTIVEAAKAETNRLEQVGRLGVVIVPPRRPRGTSPSQQGIVRLREDAYAAAGRPNPDTSRTPDSERIKWESGTRLKAGQVVVVNSTFEAALTVRPLSPSPGLLPVEPWETKHALGLLGIRSYSEDLPEEVEFLEHLTSVAATSGMDYEPPRLEMSSTEDGVLVRENDGTALAFVTPLGPVAAMLARNHSSAQRVVGVDLTPQPMGPYAEFRVGDVLVVPGQPGSDFIRSADLIRDEIRAARRATGSRRKISPGK